MKDQRRAALGGLRCGIRAVCGPPSRAPEESYLSCSAHLSCRAFMGSVHIALKKRGLLRRNNLAVTFQTAAGGACGQNRSGAGA